MSILNFFGRKRTKTSFHHNHQLTNHPPPPPAAHQTRPAIPLKPLAASLSALFGQQPRPLAHVITIHTTPNMAYCKLRSPIFLTFASLSQPQNPTCSWLFSNSSCCFKAYQSFPVHRGKFRQEGGYDVSGKVGLDDHSW